MRDRLRLRDDRHVDVRPIRATDARELQQAFTLLSEASRYQRFHTGTPFLTDRIAQYLTDIDHFDHEAMVAVSEEADIVGVARFIRSAASPGEADLAVTVADAWQRVGLGAALLELLAERARAAGLHAFTTEMLSDNVGILALVQAAGGRTQAVGDLVVTGRIELTEPREPLVATRGAPRGSVDGVDGAHDRGQGGPRP